ncbi:hypothetical protein Tco_0714689, partial [Tanacetum coccineum]
MPTWKSHNPKHPFNGEMVFKRNGGLGL